MEYELTRIDESHFNLLLAPSCRDKKWPRAVMELAGRSWRTRMQTLTPSLPENRQLTNHYFVDIDKIMQTLQKAQRTRGLRSAYQINFFRPYRKFLYKFKSTNPKLQNLDQA